LKLTVGHGPPYLSDHFLNQIRSWGTAPSFAFVSDPETNGAVERFFRTLDEQVICGRILRRVDGVRAPAAKFFHDQNHHGRLEKLGFMTSPPHRTMRLKEAAA
jgi:hypothetical protein